jgi:hypothetical protein
LHSLQLAWWWIQHVGVALATCELELALSRASSIRLIARVICRVEDVLIALEAALEVNDHLAKDVEAKGSRMQELQTLLAACEQRCQDLSKKLQEARHQEDPLVYDHVSVVVRCFSDFDQVLRTLMTWTLQADVLDCDST